MKLGMQVGLGPCHIVLGGDPAPPPLKGHGPPIFGPYLLRPNGCMDQDVTWYGGRPRPKRLCVRWEPRSSLPKRGSLPIFCPCLLRPNGWMDEAGTWHGGRPQPELRTLRTQDTSDPGHFGTSLVGPNCPDRSAVVPKCPKDSSDLSAELSCPKCRSVLARF